MWGIKDTYFFVYLQGDISQVCTIEHISPTALKKKTQTVCAYQTSLLQVCNKYKQHEVLSLMLYFQVSIVQPDRPRLLEFEKKIVLVV